MTKEQYKKERVKRGLTQTEIGKLLGIHFVTVCRRERGNIKITMEAASAIRSLPWRRRGK